MQVAKYYNNHDVRLEELPKPQIGNKEILVKVIASGICGSDVMEWYRIKKAPLVLGHEISGEIAEVGKGIKNYKVGQRVFVSHHVPCNSCRYCQSGNHTVCETLHTTNYFPGGFSEYIRVPQINVERGVFLLPGNLSFEEGTFIEPVACVLRGQRMANLLAGQSLIILGAGISGLLHLLCARAKGVKNITVTDVNNFRLKLAEGLGATLAVNAKTDVAAALGKANEGRLADLVVVCTGAFSAFEQALQCVDRAGSLLCFAPTEPGVKLPIPVNDFWRQSIKVLHSYGASPSDLAEAIELLRAKKSRLKN
ncbi:MAG: alcohol dehydrogenase catalytic domain-containing protein [Candidatus Omnitrophota bacterium]